jgi:N-acetylglutamate synthase
LHIEALERAAALHWQAPETERLGDWLLRAGGGFTGRANSALPLGDPGVPLPEAVAAVEDWYRHRGLPPMIVVPGVLPQGPAPGPLENLLTERGWLPRPDPAFVMTAAIADIPARTDTDVRLDPEPDESWLALYRYRGQDLPPIARTLLMSAPVRLPRLPSLPLRDCALSRHRPYVLWVITGSRYVCDYGDPCP